MVCSGCDVQGVDLNGGLRAAVPTRVSDGDLHMNWLLWPEKSFFTAPLSLLAASSMTPIQLLAAAGLRAIQSTGLSQLSAAIACYRRHLAAGNESLIKD